MLKYVLVAVRTLCFQIDQLILMLNGYLFEIFIGLTKLRFRNSYIFDQLATRLYVLIGIFMVFRVTFALIQMLANPDLMTDKEKGLGKLATRIVISLSLLVLTPFIFEKAMDLQSTVVEENILAKIILGPTTNVGSNSTIKSQGENIAFQVLKGFISPNEDLSDNDKNSENYKACENAYTNATDVESLLYPDVNNHGRLNCLTDFVSDDFYYSYLFLISTVGSLILAWMVVGFCIDIASRLIKLGFYQIIAPIPIISYVNGDKNGPFNMWVKKCLSTYISVFIKMITIYFVIYMCSMITNSGIDWDVFNGASPGVKQLAEIAVVLGLIVFAKSAPKLIKDMFGIKGDDDDGGFTKKLAQMALLGGAGMVVGGLNRGGAGIRNFGNVMRDKNAGLLDRLGAGVGMFTGAAGGALSGAFRGGSSGYRNGLMGIRDFGRNTQRMNELANRRFARQAAFRAENPATGTFAGFTQRVGARMENAYRGAGDAVSTFTGGGTRAERQDRVMQNLKNIADLRNQMKSQADFFSGTRNGQDITFNDRYGNTLKMDVKGLKQRYDDLMHSGTASDADILKAREVYEDAQSSAISYLASQNDTAVYSLAQEMQRNVIEGQNSTYSNYFSGMSDVASGNFTDSSTKAAFIDASNNQIIFQNSDDYRLAHNQANNRNNNGH